VFLSLCLRIDVLIIN